MNIVNHLIYHLHIPLPPLTAVFYEYITCANGIFVRAENDILRACLPVVLHRRGGKAISGLQEMVTHIEWKLPKVPITLLHQMSTHAKQHRDEHGGLIEQLYHIRWHLTEQKYALHIPAQHTGRAFATSEATETPTGYLTIADFHSHGDMDAYFSPTDDRDEKRFRCYGVLGCLNSANPAIVLRLGIYGHWIRVGYKDFFTPAAVPNSHPSFRDPTEAGTWRQPWT